MAEVGGVGGGILIDFTGFPQMTVIREVFLPNECLKEVKKEVVKVTYGGRLGGSVG